MKNLLLFAFCTLIISKSPVAQVSKVMPPDAGDFYDKSMPLLRKDVRNIVLLTAKAIENRKINADSLNRVLHRNTILKRMSNNDIEGIIVLIMVQASKDADADLKSMVLEISHKNGQQKENEQENNEMQNLKLQTIMNRKSDMAEEVSYVMKKISGTQQNIINNLK